jgi:hypothetical protein
MVFTLWNLNESNLHILWSNELSVLLSLLQSKRKGKLSPLQTGGGGCAFWFWGSAGKHLHNANIEAELLILLVGCWLRWPGDCNRSRLTALQLERLLGVLALHWSSLDGACCSVKPGEARELIWLVPTKVFADLLLSLVALWLPERIAQTPELHCSNSTC